MQRIKNIFYIYLKILILNFTCINFALSQVTEESKILSECEFIYTYTAQFMQLKNNNGAATNLLFRASLNTTALFFISAENGKISAEKIKQFEEYRKPIKIKLDNKIEDPLQLASVCDKKSLKIVERERSRNKLLWDLGFDELQNQLFEKQLKNLGVK